MSLGQIVGHVIGSDRAHEADGVGEAMRLNGVGQEVRLLAVAPDQKAELEREGKERGDIVLEVTCHGRSPGGRVTVGKGGEEGRKEGREVEGGREGGFRGFCLTTRAPPLHPVYHLM